MNPCERCGAVSYHEEDGLFFCNVCQTQSQGMTQEVRDEDDGGERAMTKEVKTKKIREKKQRIESMGISWTTTEAFNLILLKQTQKLTQIPNIGIDARKFQFATLHVWCCYLRASEIAFCDNETEIGHKLHPASRYRDIQILKHRVESLPKYKNALTTKRRTENVRLGNDRVMMVKDEDDHVYDEHTHDDDYLIHEDAEDLSHDDDDDDDDDDNSVRILYESKHLTHEYITRKKRELILSKEMRQQMNDLLSQMDLHGLLEETLQYMDSSSDSDDSDELKVNDKLKDIIIDDRDSEDSLDKSLETDDISESYRKPIKEVLKFVPLKYLKESRHNSASNLFIDLMTLPKTLALLNLVLRKRGDNVFTFDLIRWVNESHIPYFNCLSCLPNEWKYMSIDAKTFALNDSPYSNSINMLTVKLARHIGIHVFPNPNMQLLLRRFVVDLNLPLELVNIIETEFNLYHHFPKQLCRSERKYRKIRSIPFYERWALMAIVMVLKRAFVLDDRTEVILYESVADDNDKELFNWYEWEQYARLRLKLIVSHYVPIYGKSLEKCTDINVIKEHYQCKYDNDRETQPITGQKCYLYDDNDFRVDIQRDFQQFTINDADESIKFPEPSLYPLTSATEFSLKRCKSQKYSQQLSRSFTHQHISPWLCDHFKSYHRPYVPIDIGDSHHPQGVHQWSSSFRLLIELSCIILQCQQRDLYRIINAMEKVYFDVGNALHSEVKNRQYYKKQRLKEKLLCDDIDRDNDMFN